MEKLSRLTRALWAKSDPPKSLWHHMLDSGLCAVQLAEDCRFSGAIARAAELFALTRQETVSLIAYLCALHDGYGKAAPRVPEKRRGAGRPFCTRGSMISMLDKAQEFATSATARPAMTARADGFCIPPLAARIFASAIRLHHQGKHGHANAPKREKERWQAMGDELHRAIMDVFFPPLERLNDCRALRCRSDGAFAMIVLADWIASSEPFSPSDEALDDAAYISASQRSPERRSRRYGLSSPQKFPQIDEYRQMWPAFSASALRPCRRPYCALPTLRRGLTIIEAPMGEGKTEAGAFQARAQLLFVGETGRILRASHGGDQQPDVRAHQRHAFHAASGRRAADARHGLAAGEDE